MLAASTIAFPLAGGEGENIVSIQFTDDKVLSAHYTKIQSDNIILDTVKPVVARLGATGWINSRGWTSAAAVTASSADATTAVMRLTVVDVAGNSGYLESSMTVDKTAPTAPAVTGTTSPGAVLPSFSRTTGGGGSGIYHWNFDSGAWSADLTGTGYSATSLAYGSHTFYVQERDTATLVSKTPLLVYGTSTPKGTTYEIWAKQNIKGAVYAKIASPLTQSFQVPKKLPLTARMRYYWYYVVMPSFGKPYTSPAYYFTTGP